VLVSDRDPLGSGLPLLETELSLIEREDDTRSLGNFLLYFSHSSTMSCPSKG
jgi:hypothetical protein